MSTHITSRQLEPHEVTPPIIPSNKVYRLLLLSLLLSLASTLLAIFVAVRGRQEAEAANKKK